MVDDELLWRYPILRTTAIAVSWKHLGEVPHRLQHLPLLQRVVEVDTASCASCPTAEGRWSTSSRGRHLDCRRRCDVGRDRHRRLLSADRCKQIGWIRVDPDATCRSGCDPERLHRAQGVSRRHDRRNRGCAERAGREPTGTGPRLARVGMPRHAAIDVDEEGERRGLHPYRPTLGPTAPEPIGTSKRHPVLGRTSVEPGSRAPQRVRSTALTRDATVQAGP